MLSRQAAFCGFLSIISNPIQKQARGDLADLTDLLYIEPQPGQAVIFILIASLYI